MKAERKTDTEWQRLEAEYEDATPDRRAEIDQRLDELEY